MGKEDIYRGGGGIDERVDERVDERRCIRGKALVEEYEGRWYKKVYQHLSMNMSIGDGEYLEGR